MSSSEIWLIAVNAALGIGVLICGVLVAASLVDEWTVRHRRR